MAEAWAKQFAPMARQIEALTNPAKAQERPRVPCSASGDWR